MSTDSHIKFDGVEGESTHKDHKNEIEVLGWSWLFAPFEWQFTARALNQTTAIFFYGTVLREHCEMDPSLGFDLFKRMAPEMVKRLQSARRRLLKAEATGFSPRCRKRPYRNDHST